MEFAYQTQTKQYNDQSHLVCVEHGFVVNKTHTSITIIFQIVWHFASASGLKFSHDDHNKDNDWIFSINEISISNTK